MRTPARRLDAAVRRTRLALWAGVVLAATLLTLAATGYA